MHYIDYDYLVFDEYVEEIHGPQSEVEERKECKPTDNLPKDELVFNFGYHKGKSQ